MSANCELGNERELCPVRIPEGKRLVQSSFAKLSADDMVYVSENGMKPSELLLGV